MKDGEYTDEMKERHKAERDALEAEIDAEAAAMEKDMNEALENEHLESIKSMHREVIEEVIYFFILTPSSVMLGIVTAIC